MRFMVRGLISVVALCAAQSAAAQCVSTSDPTDDGDDVVCTGVDTDGLNQEVIGNGNLDEIELSIRSGALLNNADDTSERTVELDDEVTIINRGTIRSESSDAIELDEEGTIRNIGTIDGGDEAIQIGVDGTIINTASGTILADDKGITTDEDGLTVINRGLIDTVDESIEGGDDALIENRGFGVIDSEEDDAIQIGEGEIFNARNAVITSEGGDGIDIDAGVVINRGLIETTATGEAGIDVDGGPGDLEIVNSGTIAGAFGILTDDANTGEQVVFNSGTISAFDGAALYLGDGDDSLLMQRGSEIIGDADFGSGDDVLAFLSADVSFSSGALFDGGDDFDSVLFDFRPNRFTTAIYDHGVFTFGINDGAFDWTVSLTNWESFTFRNGLTVSADELASRLAPVPLPAGGLLLLSGLGLLALRRRAR